MVLCEGLSPLTPGPFDAGVKSAGLDSLKEAVLRGGGTAGKQWSLVIAG